MSTTTSSAPSPAPPAPVGDAPIDPDYIELTLLSPSPEVINDGRMNYPKIALATTISQLKERIQNDLPARPPPPQQRLIYRGRALHGGELTLRQVFRPQLNPSEYSPSYTLHLVLPPSSQANATTGPSPAAPPMAPRTQGSRSQVVNLPATLGTPTPTIGGPQNLFMQAQATQDALRQQLNQLQQQMAAVNPALGQGHHGQPITNSMQVTYQITGGPIPQINGGQMPLPFPPGFLPGAPNVPNLQEMLGRQQTMRAQAGMQGTHHQNSVQLNQTGTPSSHFPQASDQSNTTTDIPTTRVHETVGPNGSRVRTVIQIGGGAAPGRGTVAPVNRTATASDNNSSVQADHAHLQDPNIMNRSNSGGPSVSELPGGPHRHLPFPFTAQQTAPSPAGQPNAWVLSSPSGPQALLFAPGHGYFASPSSQTTAQAAHSRSARHRQGRHANLADGIVPNMPIVPAPADVAIANPAARQLALQPQQQVPGEPQNRNQANADDNDMFAIIVQRGWLFLRLYMFTFVLSDAGTWRRWFLLALAIFACLLPRDNPINDVIAAVRRHVDNLVGPPAPLRQAQPGAGARNGQANPSGTNQTQAGSAAVTTPEEAATRLLRQHQQRHPNVLRDALFRIERALALFLASLVPGVGERHVRAREDARRILTEERERVAAEETTRQEEQLRAEASAETKEDKPGSAGSGRESERHIMAGEVLGENTVAAGETGDPS